MHIRIDGIPGPQGSKTPWGTESSKAVGPWREAIRAECQKLLAGQPMPYPRGVPVAMRAVFYLPRPGGHYGTGRNAGQLKPSAPEQHVTKPDRDKLERAVMDGLKAGGVWHDDAQNPSALTVKVYVDDGQRPGCDIWLTIIPKNMENPQ